MANLHWKPVSACDSLAGLTIASEFKSRDDLRGMPRGFSIEKAFWLPWQLARGRIRNILAEGGNRQYQADNPSPEEQPAATESLFERRDQSLHGPSTFEWFGLVVKTTSPPSIFMLVAQQESTGLADVLVQWSNWKTDLLGK